MTKRRKTLFFQAPVLQHVNEAPRRRDDDLAPHPELEPLLLPGEAADDAHGADAQRGAELVGLLLDLERRANNKCRQSR